MQIEMLSQASVWPTVCEHIGDNLDSRDVIWFEQDSSRTRQRCLIALAACIIDRGEITCLFVLNE